MWNLSGDDVQRAKEEIKGRCAAIQARYESELKQLETAIADIETFELAAVNFVASFKGEAASPAAVAEPTPAPETAVADSAAEQAGAVAEAEQAAVTEPVTEPVTSEKGSSRWRMRLSNADASS